MACSPEVSPASNSIDACKTLLDSNWLVALIGRTFGPTTHDFSREALESADISSRPDGQARSTTVSEIFPCLPFFDHELLTPTIESPLGTHLGEAPTA